MGKRKASKKNTKAAKPKSRRVSSKAKITKRTTPKTVEKDTSPIEWKKKNIALQDLVEKQAREVSLKNRELEIEAALERVRARTMAMQTSSELQEAAHLLFKQVQALGIPVWSCGYNIWEPGDEVCTGWMSSEGMVQPSFTIPLAGSPTFIRFKKSKENGELFYVEEVGGETLVDHYKFMLSLQDFAAIAKKHIDSGFPLRSFQINHVVNFKHGNLIFITSVPVPESYGIFKRFTIVFEQTYTRFLDLQKAEAQAREAQIEAALERVRSKTMAMHNSNDVGETVATMFAELVRLGVATNGCGILIFNDEHTAEVWTARSNPEGKATLIVGRLNLNVHNLLSSVDQAWKSNASTYQYELIGDDIVRYYDAINRSKFYPVQFDLTKLPSKEYHTDFFFGEGAVFAFTPEPIADEHVQIFKRFAGVFGQTYRRYLDLQKAEAQARESNIQLALERVRARTMAMHKSDELLDVIIVVSEQLQQLNIKFGNVSFGVNSPEYDLQLWMAVKGYPKAYRIQWTFLDNPGVTRLKEAQQNPHKVYADVLTQVENNEWMQHIFNCNPTLDIFTEENKQALLVTPGFARSIVIMKDIFLVVGNYAVIPYSDEANTIFKRFANVFEQAYTRFLDLQKAEAQAHEALIEVALERVRSKAMAMHNTSDLSDAATVVFSELKKLGIDPLRSGIGIIDKEPRLLHTYFATSSPEGDNLSLVGSIVMADHPELEKQYELWTKKENYFTVLSGDELKSYYRILAQSLKEIDLDLTVPNDYKQYGHWLMFSDGFLFAWSEKKYSDNEIRILERFKANIELTFKRYFDLHKAEAQARESQIEAGLERVRASSMAMHHSDDLKEVIRVVSEQLQLLGIEFEFTNFILVREDGSLDTWIWAPAQPYATMIEIPNHNGLIFAKILDAFRTGEDFLKLNVGRDDKNAFMRHFYEETIARATPEERKQYIYAKPSFTASFAINKILLCIANYDERIYSEEENGVLGRFGKVFDQAYTRYLDLQKAEAQAREAQIEAALEKIRSRSLAMHHSNELKEVIAIFFERLSELNVLLGTVGIQLFDQNTMNSYVWVGNAIQDPQMVNLPHDEELMRGDNLLKDMWQARIEGVDIVNKEYTQDQKDIFFNYIFSNNDYHQVPESARNILRGLKKHIACLIVEKNSALLVDSFTGGFFSDEQIKVLRRGAKVFEQAYIRFLDLQKAEAQTMEARIEAALERVRARAMAMHTSLDLEEVVHELRKQMGALGQSDLDTCVIHLHDESPDYIRAWAAIRPPGSEGEIHFEGDVPVPKKGLKIIEEAVKNYNKRLGSYVLINEGEKMEEWLKYMKNTYPKSFEKIMESSESAGSNVRSYWSFADFTGGSLLMVTLEPPVETSRSLLQRFANVFGLAYRRFVDLKRAEAQTREAQIEAALERVRGKAMAMHNSNDLAATASLVFGELRKLGISPLRCGVGLIDKETRKALLYSATSSEEGDALSVMGWVMLKGHPVLAQIFESWIRNEEYFPELDGEELKSYYKLLLEGMKVPVTDFNYDRRQFGHFVPFSLGQVYAWSETLYSEADVKVLKRFATIIDLTFRRYVELQKSEENTREAVKQAALDRIRADIASMRTVADLDRITPLIWNELTTLGVPFNRCGVFIMDRNQRQIHTFLSTPEGKAIAAFHLPFEVPGKIGEAFRHWQTQTSYAGHWDKTEFTILADILVSQGTFKTRDHYFSTLPAEGFWLHFLPFLQGMLYVGNLEKLGDDDTNLVQSVASAFSTAYARYEDFNKLESAKTQVEQTLSELKQTQQQLIQSEKMASLGELTAGIAHEIQNPLNFVNNFSELNKELLAEMASEIEKGNYSEAKDIAKTISENQEKINNHGKRADEIVKGMLQHSRTSSGQKELTDLNVLVDEYLRLAYHGLRAKDKSFNAKFETDFDPTLPKTKVVSQDIGRVILNLINNAFYAVNEKSKQQLVGYEPTVIASTRSSNGVTEISVSDNGNGIPEAIREKIFQPFFTTKPTGQGTGLGLSLAYDIVTKGHGGELTVQTKNGEGSEFVVKLPVV